MQTYIEFWLQEVLGAIGLKGVASIPLTNRMQWALLLATASAVKVMEPVPIVCTYWRVLVTYYNHMRVPCASCGCLVHNFESLCTTLSPSSANWFDEIMTYHDMSPKVTMLNWKIFGDLWWFNMVTFDDIWLGALEVILVVPRVEKAALCYLMTIFVKLHKFCVWPPFDVTGQHYVL